MEKMINQYERMFGCKPKEFTSPLEKADHPKIEASEELDQAWITVYQSMIGSLQWALSLGRFDIKTTTMTIFHVTALHQGKIIWSVKGGCMVNFDNSRDQLFKSALKDQISRNYLPRSLNGLILSMERLRKRLQRTYLKL
jgi:hypothetical protein